MGWNKQNDNDEIGSLSSATTTTASSSSLLSLSSLPSTTVTVTVQVTRRVRFAKADPSIIPPASSMTTEHCGMLWYTKLDYENMRKSSSSSLPHENKKKHKSRHRRRHRLETVRSVMDKQAELRRQRFLSLFRHHSPFRHSSSSRALATTTTTTENDDKSEEECIAEVCRSMTRMSRQEAIQRGQVDSQEAQRVYAGNYCCEEEEEEEEGKETTARRPRRLHGLGKAARQRAVLYDLQRAGTSRQQQERRRRLQ